MSSKRNDERLELLRDEAERLVRLLKDPHPGLVVWNIALDQRIQAINDVYLCRPTAKS